jgi:hypothetical protein
MSSVGPGQGRFCRDLPRSGESWRRVSRNEKVRGSNPLSSTNGTPSHLQEHPGEAGSFYCQSAFLSRCAPPAPQRETLQSRPVRGRAEVVQVDLRGGDRGVPEPGLDGDGIDAARQPEARRGVPQIVDPATRRSRRPADCLVELSAAQQPDTPHQLNPETHPHLWKSGVPRQSSSGTCNALLADVRASALRCPAKIGVSFSDTTCRIRPLPFVGQVKAVH